MKGKGLMVKGNDLPKEIRNIAKTILNQGAERHTQDDFEFVCKYGLEKYAKIVLANKKLCTQENFDLLFKSFPQIFQMQDIIKFILVSDETLWTQKNFELVCKYGLEEPAKIILENEKMHTKENFKLVLKSFSLRFKIESVLKSILDKKSELWTQDNFELACREDLGHFVEIILRNKELHTQKNFEFMLDSFFIVYRFDNIIQIIFEKNPKLWTQENLETTLKHGLVESAKFILQNKNLKTHKNYKSIDKTWIEDITNLVLDNSDENNIAIAIEHVGDNLQIANPENDVN
jgi:hypothetical protein